MKKLALILAVVLCFLLGACGSDAQQEEQQTETEQITTSTTEPTTEEETQVSYIKEITGIDDDEMSPYVKMGLDSVALTRQGQVIVTTNGALAESLDREVKIADGVKDISILPFGNGGYRSLILIKTDNTVSAVNTRNLLENFSINVMDNLGSYTDVDHVEGISDVSATGINVVTINGDRYSLDPFLE